MTDYNCNMNKKRIIIGSIIILGLSFLFHSVYEKFPSTLISYFFPVNESIWEHNKMIVLSFLVWAIIEKVFSKSGKSVIFLNLIAAILCIVLLNATFTPIYLYILKKKENLILTIILYAISIICSFIISEKFLFEKNDKLEILSIVGYATIFIIMGILTYNPPHLPLFYDYKAEIYGIPAK